MAAPFEAHTSFLQRLADHLFFPVNMWLGEETSRRLGLTPIDHERIRFVLPYCRGRLLDVACGNNLLVLTYGNGTGCDIHPYPRISVRCDSAKLPFRSGSFDSVAMLACLNHIVSRRETIEECRRVLRDGGRLLVTMIPPWVGRFSHPIRRRHDPDQLERGMSREEEWGLRTSEVARLLAESGFRLVLHRRFMWGLNNFYMALKCRSETDSNHATGASVACCSLNPV
jgi:SAM-dependent methyltransferase